jgi:hypothetical protein
MVIVKLCCARLAIQHEMTIEMLLVFSLAFLGGLEAYVCVGYCMLSCVITRTSAVTQTQREG